MLSRNKEIRANTKRISRLLVRSEQKFDLRIKFHFRRSDLRSDLRSDWLVCLEFQGLSLINALRTLNFAKENCNRHEALKCKWKYLEVICRAKLVNFESGQVLP